MRALERSNMFPERFQYASKSTLTQAVSTCCFQTLILRVQVTLLLRFQVISQHVFAFAVETKHQTKIKSCPSDVLLSFQVLGQRVFNVSNLRFVFAFPASQSGALRDLEKSKQQTSGTDNATPGAIPSLTCHGRCPTP